jgi:glycosyltransferase involved in cell wall biosynthesis
VELLGVPTDRIQVVYLSAGSDWIPPTSAERTAARARIAQPADRPLIAFVGALGHDDRKGFDTLFEVFLQLCGDSRWNADLVVAGGGPRLNGWREMVRRHGLERRIRLLGFTDKVQELLAGVDLLVSPVRYEAYGLNVHEAIARGVPALVSACAGIAERYPDDLKPMLLPDPEDRRDLAERLRAWRNQPDHWRRRFEPFTGLLAGWTWRDMAKRFVEATR